MRVLVQRVARSAVRVDGEVVGQIGRGLLALVGVHVDDGDEQVRFLADKCAHLRIFADDEGRFNRSVLDAGGQVLAISQFTLYGDTRKGRRPGFSDAAPPERAEPLYAAFVERLRNAHGLTVATGVFGAHMEVEIHNDGPVTLLLETPSPEATR